MYNWESLYACECEHVENCNCELLKITSGRLLLSFIIHLVLRIKKLFYLYGQEYQLFILFLARVTCNHFTFPVPIAVKVTSKQTSASATRERRARLRAAEDLTSPL
jgi:hypothetical protein